MAERDLATQRTQGLTAPQMPGSGEGLVTVEAARAAQEVYMMMLAARNFPRNTITALDRILNECTRVSLADKAVYEYPRGGTKVTGPSIRLAEVLARHWGNMDYGFKELMQGVGKSTVQAHCLDLETNVRVTRTFDVPHIRVAGGKRKDLNDPRDIYELMANQAQRRVRACILESIPGDIVDEAVERCNETLKASVDITPETIKALVDTFNELGIVNRQLEAHISRHLDAITPGQVLQLKRIYRSIRDGMSTPETWFAPLPTEDGKEPEQKAGISALKSTVQRQTAQPSQPATSSVDTSTSPTPAPTVQPQTQETPSTGEEVNPIMVSVPLKQDNRTRDWTAWGSDHGGVY